MKEKLDDKAALTQYLDKTSDTSQYLLSLVNDILDLSKLEQSHIIMANEEFSLTEMVELLADIMGLEGGEPEKCKSPIANSAINLAYLSLTLLSSDYIINLLGFKEICLLLCYRKFLAYAS